MPKAARFKQVNVPRQAGELARLKILQGPDFGSVFVLTSPRATIGRGEDNEIMVSDLKASRLHAEFSMLSMGGWSIKDLGSANGILHNGKATRIAALRTGDTVAFGETTLEFISSEAGTAMLMSPGRNAEQLRAEAQAFESQKRRVRSMGTPGNFTAASPASKQPPNKRVMIYGGAAVLVAGFFLFTTPPSQVPAAKKDGGKKRDLASYLPSADPTVARSAEQFFKAGFREYTAGNYLRAKNQFETVLQMSPGHPLATLYQENCNKKIEADVKAHMKRGGESLKAGRLKDARSHFESVQRILFNNQSSDEFKESKDQLEAVKKQMSGIEDKSG